MINQKNTCTLRAGANARTSDVKSKSRDTWLSPTAASTAQATSPNPTYHNACTAKICAIINRWKRERVRERVSECV